MSLQIECLPCINQNTVNTSEQVDNTLLVGMQISVVIMKNSMVISQNN